MTAFDPSYRTPGLDSRLNQAAVVNTLYVQPTTYTSSGGTPALEPRHPSTVLVTGGTGSFGRAYVEHLLRHTQNDVVVYSRDEHKQSALAHDLMPFRHRLRLVIGDVRDRDRLREALGGVRSVVHAAALKTVPGGEQHGSEFAATNVVGTQNLIAALKGSTVRDALFISTDKAVAPRNTYGMTKALAERLWLQSSNDFTQPKHIVRGGNVWGSAGSVLRVWLSKLREGAREIDVYGPDATRFHVEMGDWVTFVEKVRTQPYGGTISVPVLRAWRLGDLAASFAFEAAKINRISGPIGVRERPARPGDKPAEALVGPGEAFDDALTGLGGTGILSRTVLHDPGVTMADQDDADLYRSDRASRIEREELDTLVAAFLAANV